MGRDEPERWGRNEPVGGDKVIGEKKRGGTIGRK